MCNNCPSRRRRFSPPFSIACTSQNHRTRVLSFSMCGIGWKTRESFNECRQHDGHITPYVYYMMECTCVTTARVKSNRAYFEKFHRTGLWVVREQSFKAGVGRFFTHSSLRKLRSQSHMLNIVSPEPARSFSPSTGFLVIAETSPQSDHFKWEPPPRSGRYRFFQRPPWSWKIFQKSARFAPPQCAVFKEYIVCYL